MKLYSFSEVIADVTSKFRKIKASEYQPQGRFKIIDQGQKDIAGYTDDETLINKTHSPIIVFGDHTRALKFVEFPIALGADGAKALAVNSKLASAHYVYYYLRSINLKGAGYSRHFKFLKQLDIPIPELDGKPNLDDQKRIAHLLSKVEGLIAQRKQHLQQLDDLLKSVFLEMFGDPVRNEKGWDTSELEKLCEEVIDCPHSTPVYSDEQTGYYCVRSGDIVDGYLDLSKTLHVGREIYEERIKRYTPQIDDIVYSREGGRLGNAARILGGGSICLGQRIMLFKAGKENSADFLWALLESRAFKAKLQGLVGGGAAPRVNIKDLKKIVVIKPPHNIQTQFSLMVKRIDEIKSRYQQSQTDLENLYGALSQKAFKGELDLSRVLLPDQASLMVHEVKITDTATAVDQIKINEYPMSEPQSRKSLLLNLFEDYLNEGKGQQLILADFWQHARWKTMDLMDEFDKPWNVEDYEQLKERVFEYIRDGRLEQTFLDDANLIQLKVRA